MTPPRRLAAVMFTDLAEFTTLSQQDEAATLAILAEHRAIVRAALQLHAGREVKTTGDGFLVEFGSALDATLCAVEIQTRSQQWRADAHGDRPFVRIGIHVGDIVADGNDILGDAVNIASRIEPLAEPGGICATRAVVEQVANKVPHPFEALPTPVLKGVHTPLEVYRLIRAGAERGPPAKVPAANRIAVLPLASISPDPNDEYLADGLTDELIGTVSKIPGLRVIARSSVDFYRTRARPLPQVGHELNVRSVVEGSVRRAGDRIRVTIQMTDVASQAPVWVHQYDRKLGDVFEIQTEIARQVAETLRVQTTGVRPLAPAATPPNPASYLAYLRGRTQLRQLTLASSDEAYAQFAEAARLDPSNARALTGMADAAFQRTMLSGEPFAEAIRTLEECKRLIGRSLALDPSAAEAHTSLAHFHDELYEFADAERELKAALSLQPTLATAHRWYARLLTEKGQPEAALDELRIAEEADPLSPDIQSILARTLIALGRADEAAVKTHRLAELEPDGMRLHYVRFETALAAHDLARLLPEIAWLSEHDPNGSPTERQAYWYGIYYATRGATEEVRRSIDTLRRAQGGGPGTFGAWADELIAELYALIGEFEHSVEHLRSAHAVRALSLELWQLRPALAPLRATPAYDEFLRSAGVV